ncbi:hypothetical protein V7138_22435 [Bacillus sp. JJ1533]|uniref:hypothetical protein n=1 Tax=Bacillus sp. JJ1533 TaxID=3122959 RepID=UPI002FFE6BE8
MKKMIFKAKYYWHSFQFNRNRAMLEGCLCQDIRTNLESKMQYHEREAITYVAKK